MALDIISYSKAAKALKSSQLALRLLNSLPTGIKWRGNVNYFEDLPTRHEVGDAYTVLYRGPKSEGGTEEWGMEFAWTENHRWEALTIDVLEIVKGKLDKISDVEGREAYIVDGNVQTTLIIDDANPTPNSLVERDGDGHITATEGTLDNHVVTVSQLNQVTQGTIVHLDEGTSTHLMNDNTVYDVLGTCTEFTPTFTGNEDELYCSELRLYSGDTEVELHLPTNATIDGFDCDGVAFHPQRFTYYKFMFSRGHNKINVIVARG